MTGMLKFLHKDRNSPVLLFVLLFLMVTLSVDSRRPRRKKNVRDFTLTQQRYDHIVHRLMTEKSYEDFATDWMRRIVELENNVTHDIYHPRPNEGERLCDDLNRFNQELESVLIPLKQQKEEIAYIARKIYFRQGPKFLQKFLPDNAELQRTFNWDNYQLGRFYRLWVETRMMWEQFKEAYLDMKIKCFYLRLL